MMIYRGDTVIKIVDWKGFDLLKLMRVVTKDLYNATRNWQLFLATESSVTLDYEDET